MFVASVLDGLAAFESFIVGCAPLIVLSSIVPSGWRVWPLLTIWILGDSLRWSRHDNKLATDCCIFALLFAWRIRQQLLERVVGLWENFGVEHEYTLYNAYGVVTVLALLVSILPRAFKSSNATAPELSNGTVQKSGVEAPKPRIFPCQTTHARMFPKRHAFAYSYLQCGYPIVCSRAQQDETGFPSGGDRYLGSWWLRVRAEDYLERGDGELGFYQKLRKYLKAQHVADSEWEYAYLVTAPRFFGYSFNPVSFWYIYDREHELKRMVLEVNNTFGERRMYLLDGSSPCSPSYKSDSQQSSADEGSEIESANASKSKFTDVWMKDFHVSPFNSRKGSYALKAQNPFPTVFHDDPRIDNTITLKSSKDHGKLVARLFSTGKSLDPDQLGFFGTAWFVLSWWWVGLVTFPRILREAGKLFFKRKLHVWFRPEVQTSSIGRLPTSAEIALEEVFRDYLYKLVNETEYPFSITFNSSIPGTQCRLISTTHVLEPERPQQDMEIGVLTPAFYSRLVHYTYTSEAIDRECVFTDVRNRTLWLCRPKLLSFLLSDRSSICIEGENMAPVKRSYFGELRWMLLRKLRCPPPDPAYSVTPQSSNMQVDDIRSRPYSELDQFVRSHVGQKHAGKYRRAVTKLFLAQRFCFGFSEVIDLVDLLLRILLCYLAVLQMSTWCDSWAGSESAKCMLALTERKDWSACFDARGSDDFNWWWLAKSALLVHAPHAYGLLKGYS